MGDGRCPLPWCVDMSACSAGCPGRREEAALVALAQRRARVRREAERLSRWSIPLVKANGAPCPWANDGDALSLAMAIGNAQLVDLARWCTCPDKRPARLFYWCRPGGGHGWGCSRCLGLVQVG